MKLLNAKGNGSLQLLGRQLKLVGQPYWLGAMNWNFWNSLAAIAIVLLTGYGLTVAVSSGANAIVTFFGSFDPNSVIWLCQSYFKFYAPALGLLVIYGAVRAYKSQNAPLILAEEKPENARRNAWMLLVTVLVFMVGVNILNVMINKISGTYTNALTDHAKLVAQLGNRTDPRVLQQESIYWAYMYFYAAIFVVGTSIVVYNAWFKRVLFLHWRRWLTYWLLDKYLGNERAFHRINGRADIDNPDERIHQDVQNFVDGALSLVLTILGAMITLVSFLGILWGMSHLLTWSVIGYAALGTVITMVFGHVLVVINGSQLRYEADARFGMTHVRNNAESIAFYQGQEREKEQIHSGFRYVFANFVRLLAAQRNLQFFTTGFDYVTIIIPAFFLAPLYFNGDLNVGVIAQASMAFRLILHALAVIVDAFPAMALFAANVHRLGAFVEALDEPAVKPGEEHIVVKSGETLAMDDVALQIPVTGRTLVEHLTFAVTRPRLIVGPSGSGKSTVLRGFGGLWPTGRGSITLPCKLEDIPSGKELMFLPQNPYMIRGTLREQLLYPNLDASVSDDKLREVLETVNLGGLETTFPNGFDEYRLLWKDVLSMGQQQRLAIARLLLTNPKIAILDEATSSLDTKNEARIYKLLQQRGILYLSVGHRPTLLKYHPDVLEIKGDTGFELMTAQEYARRQAEDDEA
jgi:putative ATP-binding cassette transporter